MSGGLACGEFGNGGLNTGTANGVGKYHDGRNQLVNTHPFLAEYMAKKNAIEKADNAADESGNSQYEGAFDQGILFAHSITLKQIIDNYMHFIMLTEQKQNDILNTIFLS